jgi:DNA-binding CsgD family transcriptional regulator
MTDPPRAGAPDVVQAELRKTHLPALVIFLLIFATLAVDLVLDREEGASLLHVTVEGVLMLLALAGAGLLRVRLRSSRVRVRRLQRDVGAAEEEVGRAREEAEAWRGEARELLAGLGRTIARQFDRWELTGAEREVALLLLKGLSHREVARVRGVTERTARDQARAVYRKAGLSGRSELSAFFLEDLLLPRGELIPEEGDEGRAG